MNITETADALGLKVRTIRRWIKLGKIRAEKRGKYWFIFDEEINRKEIQLNAYKGREHSRRIKDALTVGVREQKRQNPKKSIQRKKRKSK